MGTLRGTHTKSVVVRAKRTTAVDPLSLSVYRRESFPIAVTSVAAAMLPLLFGSSATISGNGAPCANDLGHSASIV